MKKRLLCFILAFTMLMCPLVFASSFPDVADTHWAISYIESMKSSNIINGYEDGTFQPEKQVKTGEFIKMLSVMYWYGQYQYKTPREQDHWALPYAYSINYSIIYAPDYNFQKLESYITRAEAVELIYMYMIRRKEGLESDRTESFIKKYTDELMITDEVQRLAINVCTQYGIIEGFEDGSFGGEQTLTRAQATKLLHLVQNL